MVRRSWLPLERGVLVNGVTCAMSLPVCLWILTRCARHVAPVVVGEGVLRCSPRAGEVWLSHTLDTATTAQRNYFGCSRNSASSTRKVAPRLRRIQQPPGQEGRAPRSMSSSSSVCADLEVKWREGSSMNRKQIRRNRAVVAVWSEQNESRESCARPHAVADCARRVVCPSIQLDSYAAKASSRAILTCGITPGGVVRKVIQGFAVLAREGDVTLPSQWLPPPSRASSTVRRLVQLRRDGGTRFRTDPSFSSLGPGREVERVVRVRSSRCRRRSRWPTVHRC
jgi:hypothetical protein